ncbi:MAG: hypothetical protein JST85_19870 [Acidobacteria bacterium]|nr:hypothetical protein [Acidobacteriota bacterium]
MRFARFSLLVAFIGCVSLFHVPTGAVSPTANKVKLTRAPNGGIQPQAMMDDHGTLHLIYLADDPSASDVMYVRRLPNKTFSAPLRVNSIPGSAVAIGTIRGAQIAIGKNGLVHVVWNGSTKSAPTGSHDDPMWYARLNDAGTGFEAQRNLMQISHALDGGGSVAADKIGNVYVVWHGAGEQKGEQYRRIWLARSTDDGKSFAREVAVDPPQNADNKLTGACACCGMRAFVDERGALSLLYRTATEMTERGMFLLTSTDQGKTFSGRRLDNWNLTTCPMSSATMVATAKQNLAAWENNGQVFFGAVDQKTGGELTKIAAPDATGKRKHPAIAVNKLGETILVWTEGTGWKKGGSLAWQVFDRNGDPTAEKGSVPDVPVWGLATVVAEADGSFAIIY